ncbi:glutamate-cysteine ligase family protein [Tissierella sp.]|uniref:glutamate--cysteine ligase n=1 Tax=Tissierella sp. TaxID=41274 RepID=UPI002863DE6A|nr:glutamate-cysteine ligase family protein [Tissierella sp.]MDR7855185.1 glutamate-cysteine ligase family protein [Tissierella sp.]
MNYSKQIQEMVKYFKNSEKTVDNFKIGIEFEHYIVDKDTLKTISYYGKDGVAETLKELENKGWTASYEGEYILGLEKGLKTVTLEPGSQFELSIDAQKEIVDIEREYLGFLEEIIPILEKKNQGIMTTGYHPETKIDDIKLLPKKRYDFMFNYFKTKGSHAHNMMKGTAALQVSLDYKSEEDYRKKFRIANAISPILYALFDNAFYFEGEEWGKYNLRTHIWNNCDNDRSGIVDNALEDDFSYTKYAEYILSRPPIFIFKGKEVVPTGDKLVKEIFDPEDYETSELEHLLTMFFPDVRTKRYIEIRMMDSVPYPLNLSAVAMLKGIFYNEESLELAYDYIKDINIDDIINSKLDIIENGLKGKLKEKTVLEMGKWLVDLAAKGLKKDERDYLLPLEGMLNYDMNPYEITKTKEELGKKKALSWCLLNSNVEMI